MLQSERIQLLKPELSHVDLMQQWENASANMIESQLLMPYNKFTLIDFVKHNNDLFADKQTRFIIHDKALNSAVGMIDLFNFDAINRRAEVGVLIGDDTLKNKGYATEALRLVKHYCFNQLQLNQLYALVKENNAPSLALFKKSNFQQQAVLKSWVMQQGKQIDCLVLQCFE